MHELPAQDTLHYEGLHPDVGGSIKFFLNTSPE